MTWTPTSYGRPGRDQDPVRGPNATKRSYGRSPECRRPAKAAGTWGEADTDFQEPPAKGTPGLTVVKLTPTEFQEPPAKGAPGLTVRAVRLPKRIGCPPAKAGF